MRTLARGLALLLMAGCNGSIVTPYIGGGPNNPDPTNPNPDPTDPVITVPADVSCDVTQYQNVRLEAVAGDFARTVYPKMTDAQSGCASCHTAGTAAGMSRSMKMTADATRPSTTFARAASSTTSPARWSIG